METPEPIEFIDRQISLNKDMVKALKMFNASQEKQDGINKLVAEHVDAQAQQIKNMKSVITAMNIISVVEMVILITLAVVLL